MGLAPDLVYGCPVERTSNTASVSACATATIARLCPRRGLSRSYCRWNSESFFREADQAHSTKVERTQGLPCSAGARFFCPALCLFPGATPAHELHLAPVLNTCMSG